MMAVGGFLMAVGGVCAATASAAIILRTNRDGGFAVLLIGLWLAGAGLSLIITFRP